MEKNLSQTPVRRKLSSFQTITLGFAAIILLGALLLMLPISSKSGQVTPFSKTLFTATSATCVTGLVVLDTGSYWSLFGQFIILVLIQIGGLGVITIAVALAMLSGKKISLMQRSTLQDSIAAFNVGGIVRLTRFIFKGTFIIELIGALCMMPTFISDYGIKGIWLACFHSISAFCNAGFDIFGTINNKYISLVNYVSNPIINIVIISLIIIGGIGFLTWEDICKHKLDFKKYRLQTKLILITTLILIVVPAVFFFYIDFNDLSGSNRILASLFQSVTLRTAGFNTVDLTKMSEASKMLMIMLMLIGGCPGSTAGGMKTTTIAIIFLNTVSTFLRKEDTEAFDRRIENIIVKNACTVATFYIFIFFFGGIAISVIEDLPIIDCMFETASAVGTVGLSLGLTPSLCGASHIILIILMYLGRVGGLTLIYAAFKTRGSIDGRYPLEKVTVG